MADPLDSLAQYVATDLNIGTLGQVVFEDEFPDAAAGTYDTAVLLVDTGGTPAALTLQDDTNSPSFQIISRSLNPDTAKTNLRTIFEAIHGMTERDIHGCHFKLIAAIHSGPVFLGEDARNRYLYTMAFRSMVRGVTR